MDHYQQILGINKNTSLEALKKIYKSKSKRLHPAQPYGDETDFILLNEAFEYFQYLKTGKIYDESTHTYLAQTLDPEEWQQIEKGKCRMRAQQYARMSYEDFINSQYYLSIDFLDTLSATYSYIGILLMLCFQALATYFYDVTGMWLSLFIYSLVLIIDHYLIRNAPNYDLTLNLDSLLFIFRSTSHLAIAVSLINIFLILHIGFQTLITPNILFLIFFVPMGLILLFQLLLRKRNAFKTYFLGLCAWPLFINILLFINFSFGSNPYDETYTFYNDTQYVKKRKQYSTYIYLENDVYNDYPGIRTFLDYEEMKYARYVTYTFREGLLGIKVMTDHEFNTY